MGAVKELCIERVEAIIAENSDIRFLEALIKLESAEPVEGPYCAVEKWNGFRLELTEYLGPTRGRYGNESLERRQTLCQKVLLEAVADYLKVLLPGCRDCEHTRAPAPVEKKRRKKAC